MKFTCTLGGHIILANYDRKFDVIYLVRNSLSRPFRERLYIKTVLFRILNISQICQKHKTSKPNTGISLFIVPGKDDTLQTTEKHTYPLCPYETITHVPYCILFSAAYPVRQLYSVNVRPDKNQFSRTGKKTAPDNFSSLPITLQISLIFTCE